MSASNIQAPTSGQPIPIQPDFQVMWINPQDSKLTWMAIPMICIKEANSLVTFGRGLFHVTLQCIS